jgi:hypothetical protein
MPVKVHTIISRQAQHVNTPLAVDYVLYDSLLIAQKVPEKLRINDDRKHLRFTRLISLMGINTA